MLIIKKLYLILLIFYSPLIFLSNPITGNIFLILLPNTLATNLMGIILAFPVLYISYLLTASIIFIFYSVSFYRQNRYKNMLISLLISFSPFFSFFWLRSTFPSITNYPKPNEYQWITKPSNILEEHVRMLKIISENAAYPISYDPQGWIDNERVVYKKYQKFSNPTTWVYNLDTQELKVIESTNNLYIDDCNSEHVDFPTYLDEKCIPDRDISGFGGSNKTLISPNKKWVILSVAGPFEPGDLIVVKRK